MKTQTGDRTQLQVRLARLEEPRVDRRLDEELRYRLDATLSEETKLELADPLALADDDDDDEEDEQVEPGTAILEAEHGSEYETTATEEDSPQRHPKSGARDESYTMPDREAVGADGSAADSRGRDAHDRVDALTDDLEAADSVVLARIEFADGDALVFEAVPADGEIGVSYEGDNPQRAMAVNAELASPTRLFASLAPADVPVPWLLPAVDMPPDRVQLVGGRALCDRLEEPIPAASEILRLRVPGTPSGWWTPDAFASSGYCGWNGQKEFGKAFGDFFDTSWFMPNIFKCTAVLMPVILHESTNLFGHWKRRRRSDALCAACGTPVLISIEYRKYSVKHGWRWRRVARPRFVGPTNLATSNHKGSDIRRRRIRYSRVNDTGGVRAFSRFSQRYVQVPGA